MNKALACWLVVFTVSLIAPAQQSVTQGMILSVHEQDNFPSTAGSNPSDAPLAAEVHSYEISVRVNCTVFTGRYETSLDYLPSTLVPDRTVPMRVGRHNLYFMVPGYGSFRVPIMKRRKEQTSSCVGSSHAMLNRIGVISRSMLAVSS